jgi:hypothetical protein
MTAAIIVKKSPIIFNEINTKKHPHQLNDEGVYGVGRGENTYANLSILLSLYYYPWQSTMLLLFHSGPF